MAKKFQTQLLVAESTRNRADAIALVIPDTRAEVLRRAIDGQGLRALERTYEVAMQEQLDPIAGALGHTRLELARLMQEQKLTVEDWDPATGRFRE